MKVLKVPFSGLGKGKGSEDAPLEIEKAFSELYCNEGGVEFGFSFQDVPVNVSNIDESMKSIFDAVDNCVVLGGDHSVTYGAFKKFASLNAGCGLIVFDAHADCVDDLRVTQENYLSVLVSEGILDPSKVIIVGLRNWHKNEVDFLKKNKILCFNMKKVFSLGVEEVCSLIMEKALGWSKVYVSIDIDVCDPAFAPGTGYCEPGGLSSRELIYFVQRLRRMRNIGMFDIVEINPSLDDGKTVKLGAKLLKEVL